MLSITTANRQISSIKINLPLFKKKTPTKLLSHWFSISKSFFYFIFVIFSLLLFSFFYQNVILICCFWNIWKRISEWITQSFSWIFQTHNQSFQIDRDHFAFKTNSMLDFSNPLIPSPPTFFAFQLLIDCFFFSFS